MPHASIQGPDIWALHCLVLSASSASTAAEEAGWDEAGPGPGDLAAAPARRSRAAAASFAAVSRMMQ